MTQTGSSQKVQGAVKTHPIGAIVRRVYVPERVVLICRVTCLGLVPATGQARSAHSTGPHTSHFRRKYTTGETNCTVQLQGVGAQTRTARQGCSTEPPQSLSCDTRRCSNHRTQVPTLRQPQTQQLGNTWSTRSTQLTVTCKMQLRETPSLQWETCRTQQQGKRESLGQPRTGRPKWTHLARFEASTTGGGRSSNGG